MTPRSSTTARRCIASTGSPPTPTTCTSVSAFRTLRAPGGRAVVPLRHRERRALRRDRGGQDRRRPERPDPPGRARRRAVPRGDEPHGGRRDGRDRPRRGDRQGRSVGRGHRGRVGRVRSVLSHGVRRSAEGGAREPRRLRTTRMRTPATSGSSCPGSTVALLDTAIPGATTGTITTEQLEWLDDHAASDRRRPCS